VTADPALRWLHNGYRLADAGPHPNKAHAAWGRRAHRLEPAPETAHIAQWIFARRLAGHSVTRIARALTEAEVPCPSAADPAGTRTAASAGWLCAEPAVRGRRCGTGSVVLIVIIVLVVLMLRRR